MGDLLGEDYSLAQKDKPYRCLDLLLKHRDELFQFLKGQWSNLFGAKYDVLLYDLTSTYFESDPLAAGSDSKTCPHENGDSGIKERSRARLWAGSYLSAKSSRICE